MSTPTGIDASLGGETGLHRFAVRQHATESGPGAVRVPKRGRGNGCGRDRTCPWGPAGETGSIMDWSWGPTMPCLRTAWDTDTLPPCKQYKQSKYEIGSMFPRALAVNDGQLCGWLALAWFEVSCRDSLEAIDNLASEKYSQNLNVLKKCTVTRHEPTLGRTMNMWSQNCPFFKVQDSIVNCKKQLWDP